MTALAEHRERLRLAGRDIDRGLVFPNKKDSFVIKRNVRRVFDRVVEKAGVSKIRIHDMHYE